MKRFLALIIAAITVFSVFVFPTSAANEPNALGIGFEVDKSTVKWVGWYNTRQKDMYCTDETGTSHKAGTVKIRGVEMTSKENYFGYQEDTWLTRIIVEPNAVSDYTVYRHWLCFKIKWSQYLKFSIQTVTESDQMPKGLTMSAHMSTTEANQITETIKETWTIRGTASLKYKDFSIGGGAGPTWTTNTTKTLATPYDSSRNDEGFNVKYTFLDPEHNSMTKEQEGFCYNQCIFYSSKSLYGNKQSMAQYTFGTNVSVTLVAHYKHFDYGSTDSSYYESREVCMRGTVSAYVRRAY